MLATLLMIRINWASSPLEWILGEEMRSESHSPYPAHWLALLRADRALALGDPSTALSELDSLKGVDGDPLMRSFWRVSEGAAVLTDVRAENVASFEEERPPLGKE